MQPYIQNMSCKKKNKWFNLENSVLKITIGLLFTSKGYKEDKKRTHKAGKGTWGHLQVVEGWMCGLLMDMIKMSSVHI